MKITPALFKQFGFHSCIPQDEWTVSHDPVIARFPKYRKAILMAICERLSGEMGAGIVPGSSRLPIVLELPLDVVQKDKLEPGCFACAFGPAGNVHVRNLITAQESITFDING